MNIIRDITEFIFVSDKPQQADIIFIPGGSWPEPVEKAAALWHEGYAPLILPSGKYGVKRGYFPGTQAKEELYGGVFDTEWAFMKQVLIRCGVDESVILKEDRACERGTYDNAFFSKNVTDALGLTIRRAIICCKSFHARRCLMFYAWAYPETEFFVASVDIEHTGKDDWYTQPKGIERVLSEMQKCGQYFKDAIPTYMHSR